MLETLMKNISQGIGRLGCRHGGVAGPLLVAYPDWQDKIDLGRDVAIQVLPARHYSGRLFKENKTFWAAFAIQTPARKIFYNGDSGYGAHFSQMGHAFQGFDLVMLDCGQYDPRWAYIHMPPQNR